MLLLKDNRKYIRLADFKKELDDMTEYDRVMGISVFFNRKILWMKQNFKHHAKNNKELGFSRVSWESLMESNGKKHKSQIKKVSVKKQEKKIKEVSNIVNNDNIMKNILGIC